MRTRSVAVAAAIGIAALTSACSVPQQSSETAPSSAAQGSGDPNTLTAVLGNERFPDAFEINLLDSTGKEVTELPAGEYKIEVSDRTKIHDYHLTGPGVDETTGVDEIVDKTWTVKLQPGEYTYVCDPHPRMTGSFTVTGTTTSGTGADGPTSPGLGKPGHDHADHGH